jgi:hypothetical protein
MISGMKELCVSIQSDFPRRGKKITTISAFALISLAVSFPFNLISPEGERKSSEFDF